MKCIIPFCLLVLLGACATPRDAEKLAAHGVAPDSPYDPQLLSHRFSGYGEALAFLAAREGLPNDTSSLFHIAADSDVERFHPAELKQLFVIRLDFRGQSQFGIRGAQGQGRYYAFKVDDESWQLVGIFHGSRLRWDFSGGKSRAFSHWHFSASYRRGDEIGHIWNGKFFERKAVDSKRELLPPN